MASDETIDDLIPDWVTRLVLTRDGDGWQCELTGDPRGTGNVHPTTEPGATAQAALFHAADVAEGWRSFTLAKLGRGDDGGE